MKIVLSFLFVFVVGTGFSQETDPIKKEFLENLRSDNVKEGCKITIYVINAGANAACFVPEPTVSKVACVAAQIMNLGTVHGMDPNISHPIMDFGIEVCRLTYAYTDAGIKYTFQFAENQTKEIEETWNWLNSLEGAIQFIEYLSR